MIDNKLETIEISDATPISLYHVDLNNSDHIDAWCTTATVSPSQSTGMDMNHLPPPLMERLEADLAALQKKYGIPIQQASPVAMAPPYDPAVPSPLTANVELLSTKLAAINTFISPLHNINGVQHSPMVLDNRGKEQPGNNLSPLQLDPHQSPPIVPHTQAASVHQPPNPTTVRENASENTNSSLTHTPISWAAILGGSRSTRSTPLSFIPPTIVQGLASVFITSGEFKDEVDECEKMVVGYFIGKRLPIHIVIGQVEQHLPIKGSYKIECRGDECFYFKFINEEDRLIVLERGMLHIASRLFILHKRSAKVEAKILELGEDFGAW